MLEALQEGPPAGDLGVGIRSAVPTKVEALINVTEDGSGVATVELPPGFFEQIPQEDQLLAIGQIVLTITEVGGIGQVLFVQNGSPLPRAATGRRGADRWKRAPRPPRLRRATQLPRHDHHDDDYHHHHATRRNDGRLVRSGFVTLIGRPNVGKSTLVNAMCGRKVSIVSDKPQTTRTRVRGILSTPDAQVIFVDTPGLHKPVTALGKRVNATALDSVSDVDAVCLVIDATKPFGTGDQWVAGHLDLPASIVIVNKIDAVSKDRVIGQLSAASSLGASDYFPVSAKTGEGIPELIAHLTAMMPEGPLYFPDDTVSDQPEETWVAELVREQLLAVTRDELPYSIATRVTEWEWPRIRVEIIVERESQKGMVIGKGGSVLKEVGKLARAQLPEGAYLELFVKVDKDWQRRPDRVERLGY